MFTHKQKQLHNKMCTLIFELNFEITYFFKQCLNTLVGRNCVARLSKKERFGFVDIQGAAYRRSSFYPYTIDTTKPASCRHCMPTSVTGGD